MAGYPSAAHRLRAALEQGIALGGPEVRRLSYARTSVRFSFAGQGDAVTLLLDRRPAQVSPGDEPAEIEIELNADQAERFMRGQLCTPAVVISGEAATRGPVRRYLEVDAILRGLLAQVSDQPRLPSDRGSRRPAGGTIDQELLAIQTRDLHKSFGRQEVLRGANLTIPEGVISVVLGPSGTGKSVLLQHIIGLLRPDSGDILIRGRALSRMSRSQVLALRTEIGVMFQDGALFSAMNVFDNVAFPLRQHTDLSDAEVRRAVDQRLAAVGLSHASEAMPSALSGGMKKRAGLARALVMEPSIVLCDEPDSGLDPVRTALLGDLLAEQHAQTGGTMVVITHNIALAKRLGEHISVLWQGDVLESGMYDQVINSENEFIRQFLAGETFGPLSMDA